MALVVVAGGFFLAAMTESGSYAIFLICALLIAMSYGGSWACSPPDLRRFRPEEQRCQLRHHVHRFRAGGFIGPIIATSLFAATQSYSTALLVVGIMGAVATLLVLWLTKINKSKKKSA